MTIDLGWQEPTTEQPITPSQAGLFTTGLFTTEPGGSGPSDFEPGPPPVGPRGDRWGLTVLVVCIVVAVALLVAPFLWRAIGSRDGDATTAADPANIAADNADQLLSDATAGPTDPAQSADADADAGPAPADTGITSGTLEGTAPVDYGGSWSMFTLDEGTRVIAASVTGEALIVDRVIPGTAESGCEATGSLYQLGSQSLAGDVGYAVPDHGGVPHQVVHNGRNGMIVTQSCEEVTDLTATMSIQGVGDVVMGHALSLPEDHFFISGQPVWAADGERFHVNAMNLDNEARLLTFDAATGQVIETRPLGDERIVAELYGSVPVMLTGSSIRVGDGAPVDLDNDQFGWVQATTSLNQELAAVHSGRVLVVVNGGGEVARYQTADPITAVAWSPTGDLAYATTGSWMITIGRPGHDESFVMVDPPVAETARWHQLHFTDSGRALAFSSGDGWGPAYALRFGEEAEAVHDAPVAETALTIGDQPLTLRGMGGLRIGMTVTEAEAALGATIRPMEEDSVNECRYGMLAGDGASPYLMVLTAPGADFATGTIVRIDINQGQSTLSGIGVGAATDDVVAAYGDRIVFSPHPYVSGEGNRYLTYIPADPADADHRLVFEVLDDQVAGIRSGLLPAVEWIEGCA